MADMLSGLGNFTLDLPGLSDIQPNGTTAAEQPYAGNTTLSGQNTSADPNTSSDARRKTGFNYFDAGMNAIKGATVDLVGKGLTLVQQKPLESIASVGAIGAAAFFGGPPAIFLMGALGFVGSNFHALQKFNEAGRLSADAKAAANDFRFEEAQQLHSASQAVWGGVGTGLGLTVLAGLLAHRGLSMNAAAKGVQLAKGFGGKIGEFFSGLVKRGYWAAAPEAGNVLAATSTILQRKAQPLVHQVAAQGGQVLRQARSAGQHATDHAQHLAQQATEKVQQQTPKAEGIFQQASQKLSDAVGGVKDQFSKGAAKTEEVAQQAQQTGKTGMRKMTDLFQGTGV